jgi:hypothetical protein
MRPQSMFRAAWLAPVAALMLTACFESPNDSDNNGGDGDTVTVPANYAFLGADGLSSVVYTGQTVRLLLIHDIQSAARVAGTGGAGTGSPVTAASILKYYQHVDADSLDIRTTVAAPLTRLHTKYAQIQGTRRLDDKVSPDTVIGYGVTTDSLVKRWAAQIAANSQNAAKRGTAEVYLDTNGMDLSQMLSKVLSGAVAYYQATQVYLSDITTKNNTDLVGTSNYTEMEHRWDEAFGYFGVSRDHVTNYTDDELNVAATSYKDANGDGKIDFGSEFNFSMMGRYTGRRDRGLTGQDWNGDVFRAFVKGRALITAKKSADSIAAQRAIAVKVWENVYASNVISYIKNVKNQLATDTTATRTGIAGAWSELKAFAICLQYSPYRTATNAQLAQLQALIGHGPVLSGPGRVEYLVKLDAALTLVKTIYGFSDAQVNAATWL